MMSIPVPVSTHCISRIENDFEVTASRGKSTNSSKSDVAFRREVKRKVEISPTEHDVLFFSNNLLTCGHPGNANFAKTIKRCLRIYRAYKGDIQIAKHVVDGLAAQIPPVRFLSQNTETRVWLALSTLEAIVVTNHALLRTSKQQIDAERRRNEAMVYSVYADALHLAKRVKIAFDENSTLENMLGRTFLYNAFPDCQPACNTTTDLKNEEAQISPVSDFDDVETASLDDVSIISPCVTTDDLNWSENDLENVLAVLDSNDELDLFDLI